MADTQFLQLIETNEHEGETWSFWLQFDGNEDQLAKLRDLLSELDDDAEDPQYVLTESLEPESVVDKLVEYASVDYMAAHNKVVGVFTCPDDVGDEVDEVLYKGGVRDFFASVTR